MVRVISTAGLDYDYGDDGSADGWFTNESPYASRRRRRREKKSKLIKGKTAEISTYVAPPTEKVDVGEAVSTTKFPWES